MGVFRFQLTDESILTPEAAQKVYLASGEGIPWRCKLEVSGAELRVHRAISDSGILHVPWHIPSRGPIVLTTANLREQAEPYDLAIELARGTLFRLKNQCVIWELAGLETPPALNTQIRLATDNFLECVFATDPAKRLEQTNACLLAALDAIDLLVDVFVDQIVATRRQDTKPQPTKWLACPIRNYRPKGRQERELLAAFNGAVVSPNWKEVESVEGEYRWDASTDAVQWCASHELRLCVGPLVRNTPAYLPNWLYLWQDDEDSLANYCASYVQSAVRQFEGNVGLWNVCAGFHAAGALEIPEESAVRLIAAMVGGVRQVDARTPLIVSFSQPFAEYMANESRELSPLHLADALLRAELGISGLGIDACFGDGPHDSMARDWLQWNSHLDVWSQLEIPLIVMLSGPSSTPNTESSPGYWGSQEQLLQRFVPLCLAKRNVHGVVWNQLSDADSGLPLHGLIDQRGKSKPGLLQLRKIRESRFP
ncbi:MAG: hypothetical protein O2931_08950 [Planctomycetota bacterium]|nr:hypothetical protein [Planctomycetota bacterium]MDA1178910.1 hypothetical protein [Planctomycetota bacterium]